MGAQRIGKVGSAPRSVAMMHGGRRYVVATFSVRIYEAVSNVQKLKYPVDFVSPLSEKCMPFSTAHAVQPGIAGRTAAGVSHSK